MGISGICKAISSANLLDPITVIKNKASAATCCWIAVLAVPAAVLPQLAVAVVLVLVLLLLLLCVERALSLSRKMILLRAVNLKNICFELYNIIDAVFGRVLLVS